jgi:hypothetical protein
MQESVMRREGSALHGFGVVTLKEVADHFTSILVVVLVVLVVVVVAGGPGHCPLTGLQSRPEGQVQT